VVGAWKAGKIFSGGNSNDSLKLLFGRAPISLNEMLSNTFEVTTANHRHKIIIAFMQ